MTDLSGVLLVDKPTGPTSHDVVGRVRKVAGIRRVGHAGTLDPFASGLLLILLGPATRLSEYLVGLDKTYEAKARLGIETDTHDREGAVVREDPAWRELDEACIGDALGGFLGKVQQTPPRYSAKKIRGMAAHRRVRRGEEVDLEAVEVRIEELTLRELSLPSISFRVRCSSGTYVRALARDLGRALEVGAHLTELRRTGIGSFRVEDAQPLAGLGEVASLEELLLPPARALGHLPLAEVGPGEASLLARGRPVALGGDPRLPEEGPVRILCEGRLVGVGYRRGGELKPRKVFVHD